MAEQTTNNNNTHAHTHTIAKQLTVNLCRLALAATFLFSGFVKANDPYGMTYKLQDYLAAFPIHIQLPETFLLVCSVLLGVFEFMLGTNILLGIKRKATARLTAAFMTIMTLLTVYIAIDNPVSDCGCFGDAIILSNNTTLLKNIILLACAIITLKWNALMINIIPILIKSIAAQITPFAIAAYAIYCIICLPCVDFRPYKIGTNLRTNMEKALSQQQYDIKIIYQRNGQTLELTDTDDTPDTTWTYVETKRIKLNTENIETIDFYFEDNNGDNATDELLYTDGYAIIICIPDMNNADEGCIDKINDAYDKANEQGIPFYCLTGSIDQTAQAYWKEHTGAEYPFYTADNRLLKTIVRGSPGMVLMKDGVITKKWSNYNLPTDITQHLTNVNN